MTFMFTICKSYPIKNWNDTSKMEYCEVHNGRKPIHCKVKSPITRPISQSPSLTGNFFLGFAH